MVDAAIEFAHSVGVKPVCVRYLGGLYRLNVSRRDLQLRDVQVLVKKRAHLLLKLL